MGRHHVQETTPHVHPAIAYNASVAKPKTMPWPAQLFSLILIALSIAFITNNPEGISQTGRSASDTITEQLASQPPANKILPGAEGDSAGQALSAASVDLVASERTDPQWGKPYRCGKMTLAGDRAVNAVCVEFHGTTLQFPRYAYGDKWDRVFEDGSAIYESTRNGTMAYDPDTRTLYTIKR